MKNVLYGDGIHDDYPAIQKMIDSGVCEVSLPAPKKHYLISKPNMYQKIGVALCFVGTCLFL